MFRKKSLRKLILSSLLAALALAISPVTWFAWGPTRAFPGQHLVNILAGIMVGPLWASMSAVIVGTLRIMLGVGTIFAYPGGIPGGLMVGLVHKFLRGKVGRRKAILLASFSEPIGTVLIGGTLSWYMLDPLLGTGLQTRFGALLPFYLGWALSSVSGSIIGTISVLALDSLGALRHVD
ncbi:MAG: energy coupling factor transporter S component ThiW [Thermoproteota archaeon]